MTARYAAVAPFGKVAALVSELPPLGGTQHASTVRNRTLRVGAEVVQAHAARTTNQPSSSLVVVGSDGGYVRSRHLGEGRHFEVIAGKMIQTDGAQHRFAFTRTGPAATTEAFRAALAGAGVSAATSSTALCDGDAGLWRLQREVLPGATVVLDWWHAAVRFEHALRRGSGTALFGLQGVLKRPAFGGRVSVRTVSCAGGGEPPPVKLAGAEAVPGRARSASADDLDPSSAPAGSCPGAGHGGCTGSGDGSGRTAASPSRSRRGGDAG